MVYEVSQEYTREEHTGPRPGHLVETTGVVGGAVVTGTTVTGTVE